MISPITLIKRNIFTICCMIVLISLIFFKNTSYFNDTYKSIVFAPSFILDILTIIFAHCVYRVVLKPYKKLIFYLLLAFYGLFLCDGSFYIIITVLKLSAISDLYNSFYYLPYFVAIVFLLIFWTNFVVKFISIKRVVVSFLFFLMLDMIFLIVFIADSEWRIKILSYLGSYTIVTGIIEIFIFNLAIIVLINSKNRILDILTLGTLFLITSNIWIKYLLLNLNAVNFDYTEFLNIIGIMFNLRAMILLFRNPNRRISSWTNKSTSIKTQITLFVYIICIISFFCLFFLAKNLTIVNTNSLASFPVLIMAYSVVMVFLANIMGRKFEAPFKQLEENTQTLLNLSQNSVNTDYETDEFNKLQTFIIKQIKSQAILNDNVIKAVHDCKSPLTLIGEIINSIENKIPQHQLQILTNSLKSLRQITIELLDQHRKQIQNSNYVEKSYCLLQSLINDVIDQKSIEWKENPCYINLKFFSKDIIWLNIIDIEFKNILSNLLNNAYESLNENKKDIEIIVEMQTNDMYALIIKDHGCGIPQDELLNVINGKSLKEKGNGIGLSSATKYLSYINGSLTLSSQENIGTSVYINLPKIDPPKWFKNTIIINNNSQVIIVDDDTSIHIKWQKFFISTNIKPLYFLSIDQFTTWINNQQDHSNILVLMDYELGNKYENGLTTLKKHDIKTAYLITSHAEQAWLQKLISDTNYYLIPKSLIEHIYIKV